MTLRLDRVQNCSVGKGADGYSITVEMDYLNVVSSNRRLTRNVHSGDTVLRHDVEDWMEQLAWMVKVLACSARLQLRLPLKIVVAGQFKSKVYPDLHNFHKAIGDAIEDGLGINDKYYGFEDMVPPAIVPGEEPKLIITVKEASNVK